MWQYLIGMALGAFGSLLYTMLSQRNRMIKYGKVKQEERREQKRKEEEEKRKEEERMEAQRKLERLRLQQENEEIQRQKHVMELARIERKQKQELARKEREQKEELARKEREQEELARKERERVELEAKKIRREIKRLNSPVCPSKKTCETKDCENPSDFLCSNCNIHLCSGCFKNKDPENSTNIDDTNANLDCSTCKKTKTIQKIENTDIICMKSGHEYDCFVKTCKHIYHKECLKEYLLIKPTCIVCCQKMAKEDISTDFFDPEKPLAEYIQDENKIMKCEE